GPGAAGGPPPNGMSCHGVARWPGGNNGHAYPQTYQPNGFIDFASAVWFGGQTRTDFAWAIPDNAVAAPTPTPKPSPKSGRESAARRGGRGGRRASPRRH